MTWLYNYEQCSQDLYKDNRLVEDPDIVSDTEEGAWGSAFWYWGRHCHVWPGVKEGLFGASTMAINGALECKGPYKVKAFKRFTIYVRVLKAFKLFDVKPIQDGCYPMTGPESSDFRLCEAVGAHKNAVGMYHWCNDNCNAEDPNCPQDMCECEGGNPVKKVKASNESLTEPITSSPPKILSSPQQSLQPRNPVRVFAKTQTHRRPEPKPTTESEPRPVFRHESTPGLRPDPTPAPQSDPTPDSKPDLRYRPNSRPHYRAEPTPDPDVGQPLRKSEHDIFRYHEPKRSTTPIPDLIDTTTLKPELSRTRLLRNELGRLVRKRPVNRTTTTEEPPLENNHQMFDSMKNQ